MTKREYAEAIANEIKGAEVKEVGKANGVILTGIVMPSESNVKPTVYIDKYFEDGFTVDEARQNVISSATTHEATANINTDDFLNFDYVKPKLRARLYNQTTNAEVYKSAAEYGFDDLIIIPYITDIAISNVNELGSIKVTNSLIEQWKTTADEVIRIAEENSSNDYMIRSMMEMLMGLISDSDMDELISTDTTDPILVVTTRNKICGAYAIIPALKEFKKKWNKGFVVIPSSIHEVLVINAESMSKEELNTMVNDVNETQVAPVERLGSHVYVFEGNA